jgi:hypothetical protein
MSALPSTSQVFGIVCPTPGCNAPLVSVLFTRKAVGQILRVRKCERCRRRIRTAERVVCTNSPGRTEQSAELPAET